MNPSDPVGWETHPISKARVLAPWIALGIAIVAGASLLVIRRRRAQI
jgi:LPXTG-motif cell wall-anchored protein